MITKADFERLVHAEYEWLRGQFDLAELTLEFQHTHRSGDPAYGGTPRRIVFPFSDHDLSVVYCHTTMPTQGPPTWEEQSREGRVFWDKWRTDFWHEVIHQIQDSKGFGWNPLDGNRGHKTGWQEAVVWAAERLGAPPERLYALLLSMDTPPFRPSADGAATEESTPNDAPGR
jgi:hypothetical protein